MVATAIVLLAVNTATGLEEYGMLMFNMGLHQALPDRAVVLAFYGNAYNRTTALWKFVTRLLIDPVEDAGLLGHLVPRSFSTVHPAIMPSWRATQYNSA